MRDNRQGVVSSQQSNRWSVRRPIAVPTPEETIDRELKKMVLGIFFMAAGLVLWWLAALLDQIGNAARGAL